MEADGSPSISIRIFYTITSILLIREVEQIVAKISIYIDYELKVNKQRCQ